MALLNPIPVGAEVMLRGIKDHPVGAVTKNTTDKFCVLTKSGDPYSGSRASLNPIMTGKKYPVQEWLDKLSE